MTNGEEHISVDPDHCDPHRMDDQGTHQGQQGLISATGATDAANNNKNRISGGISMADERKLLSLYCTMAGVCLLTAIFLLFFPSRIFFWLIVLSTAVYYGLGVFADVMAKMGKWKWAAEAKVYSGETSETTTKLPIIVAWLLGGMVCVLCVFVWGLLY